MAQQTVYTVVPLDKLPRLSMLGLSLSSACGADCVYCPIERGERIKTKIMPLEVAKKAIDDVSIESDNIRITEIHFGENGDAFINKNALNIFRYAKERIPSASRNCTTNLQNLSEDMINQIMSEGLLDSISFNVDGASAENFLAAKNIPFTHVRRKLPLILEAREKYGSKMSLQIFCLTVQQYAKATSRILGQLPVKLKDSNVLSHEDDYKKVEEFIVPQLKEGDIFSISTPFLWAERKAVDKSLIDYSKYCCPLFGRVAGSVLIAPDGSWYVCCFDADNEITFGNIMERSVEEISQDEPRRMLIEKLYNRKFAEIGSPCDTVNCCVPIAGGDALSTQPFSLTEPAVPQKAAPQPRKLHIGGQEKHPDWVIFDIIPGDMVDFVGSCTDMSQFETESIEQIYISHVLEHLSHKMDIATALSEFKRILIPGGKILISVPDFFEICKAYCAEDLTMPDRFKLARLAFGGQRNENDFHKFGFSFDVLKQILEEIGFRDVIRVENFGIFNDSSQKKIDPTRHDGSICESIDRIRMNINVIASKPA